VLAVTLTTTWRCTQSFATICTYQTRNNLHLPQANLAIFQKGAYYSGIKIFNSLPTEMKVLSYKPKIWKTAFKYFCIQTLCTLWINTVIDKQYSMVFTELYLLV